MIKTNDLRGIIAKNGMSQAKVAKMLGITPKTFYSKMDKGVFRSDEIQIMIDKLEIKDPIDIFLPFEISNQNISDFQNDFTTKIKIFLPK